MQLRTLSCFWFFAWFALVLIALAVAGRAASPERAVVVLRVEGAIGPATADPGRPGARQ